jgi:transposase
MKHAGVSTKVISAQIGCSKSRIYDWIQRWNQTASLERRSVSGRPKAFTKDQEEQLLQLFRNNAVQFLRAFVAILPYKASLNTILRRLEDGGFKKTRDVWEEVLLDRDRDERMSFALQHLHMSQDQWKRVIFTDFAVAAYAPATHCVDFIPLRCPVLNTPFVTQRCIYVCVWVWFSAQGAGGMHIIKDPMDMEAYKTFLAYTAIPELDKSQSGQTYMLQQHSNIVQELGNCFDQYPYISVMEWPHKSADLNPFEFVWETMKDHLLLVNVDDSTSLTHKVQDVWEMLQGKPVFWKSLVEFMPNCLKSVCDRKGDRLHWEYT